MGAALMRYINEGVTFGTVNFPEVNLRSLTLDEPNHVRVGSNGLQLARKSNADWVLRLSIFIATCLGFYGKVVQRIGASVSLADRGSQ